MVRSTRTGALLVALVVILALPGCAGVLDGASTETPTTGTDAPTDTAPDSTTDGTATEQPTSTATTTDEPADSTGTPATETPSGPSAAFVDDGETLATVTLEVADSASERRRGLMNRESLAADAGMVFVYDDAATRSFWMKNTLVPLDMVFVAPNGTVLNVRHASVQPNATDSELRRYSSDGAAQYVVEVNRGFANETGVGPGTQVEFSGLNATTETETST